MLLKMLSGFAPNLDKKKQLAQFFRLYFVKMVK